MRKALAVLAIMLCSITASPAQVSFGYSSPGVSIGINLPVYPDLVRIPGYPVYYAPRLDANYFFYDGLYWVFDGTYWYASSWYNGPWQLVTPDAVPVYLLRVPVRYYRAPPVYFRGWAGNAPPRWGVHWGDRWAHNHRGWDRWNRASAPAPAPLPTYQRRYSGNRYPGAGEQRTLESRHYQYQPRSRYAEERLRERPTSRGASPPASANREGSPQARAEAGRGGPQPQAEARRGGPPQARVEAGRGGPPQARAEAGRGGPPQGRAEASRGRGRGPEQARGPGGNEHARGGEGHEGRG